MISEIWKDIPNYEGYYQVSSIGNIRSVNRILKYSNGAVRIQKGKVMNRPMNQGYYYSFLSKNNKTKSFRTHQLVASAFLGHVPCGLKIVVDHINNIKTDNRVENLQLITNRENIVKDTERGSSSHVGVIWCKKSKKWKASIRTPNIGRTHLGYFDDEKEASLYYQNALKAHFKSEKIIVKRTVFSSKYIGVTWDKDLKKWRAYTTMGKRIHLGCFNSELDASKAYKAHLKKT
jgi:hypothetical protein